MITSWGYVCPVNELTTADLVQMAIWSLTQERIDKLKKQIGDKEEEFKKLTNTSSKQLWTTDLDDFVAEWRFQLEDEAKRAKKLASQGRRASAKLRIGGKTGSKKRKADESDGDSDFTVSRPKKAAPAANGKPKPSSQFDWMKNTDPAPKLKASQTLISAFGQQATKGKPKSDLLDGAADAASDDVVKLKIAEARPKAPPYKPGAKQSKRSRPAKKTAISPDEEDDHDVFAEIAKKAEAEPAAGGRAPRAAVRKPVKYANSDNSDKDSESEGDDLLGDVSNMVKGIPKDGAANGQAKALFSASQPSSSSSHGLVSNPIPVRPAKDDSEVEDETDYRSLVPKDSPQKPAARNAREIVLSDDDDDSLDMVAPKAAPKAAAKKIAATKTTVGALKPKKAPATAAEKQPRAGPAKEKMKPTSDLSPAAKAYKANQDKTKAAAMAPPPAKPKLAKKSTKRKPHSDDDDADALANDIIGDDERDSAPVEPEGRPSRRAAASAPKSKYVFDDEDEEEDQDESGGENFGDDDDDDDDDDE